MEDRRIRGPASWVEVAFLLPEHGHHATAVTLKAIQSGVGMEAKISEECGMSIGKNPSKKMKKARKPEDLPPSFLPGFI